MTFFNTKPKWWHFWNPFADNKSVIPFILLIIGLDYLEWDWAVCTLLVYTLISYILAFYQVYRKKNSQ